MIRYGTRYGCRFGAPHNLFVVGETPAIKVERCKICSKTFSWKKGYKGRISSKEYLFAHVREYAQPGGSTNRVFQKLHNPQKCIITV